jgi:hypothetical protein
MTGGRGCSRCHNTGYEALETTYPMYTLVACRYCYEEEATMEDSENRWSGFEDRELTAIYEALPDGETSEVEERLNDELYAEISRRDEERAADTYRGPGYYRDAEAGTVLHVVGAATIDGAPCLLVGQSMEDPHLWSLPARKIEGRLADGSRRFTYSTIGP